MHLAAVVYGGQIYTSSNYGSTWTLQRASQSTTWTSIASDSTGQYLVASVYSGSIYTSTNYGATWTARTSGVPASAQFQSVTSDGSGKYLATVVSGGTIYVSTNYGASWTAGTGLPATGSWYSVSSDYSGQYLIACTGLTTGNVYTSTNYGSSWSLTTVASGGLGLGSPAFFDTVAIGRTVTSANPYYYAAVSGEDIYSYHNNGHTIWGDYHVAKYWNSMAADATGQYLIVSSDSVYTSSNYGSTFATGTGLPSSVSWSSVASDSSGTYLAAGVYGGHIYVSQNQGANWSLGL